MRIVLTILLLLFFKSVIGQENVTNISLEIQNKSIKEILSEIEQKTNFHFYFVEEWLDNKTISKTYKNASVEFILDDIFKDTPINFFISWDKRIVLTRNNIIYGELPKDFFRITIDDKSKVLIEDKTFVNPVFLKEQRNESNFNIETIRIGKEKKGLGQKRFKLTGFITNAKTGKPISNVAIVVKETNIGTVTDEAGYYELELTAGLNLIEASSLGIQNIKKNVIIYNDGKLDLKLAENYEQLKEVVIQAGATKNIEDTSTGNVRIGSEESKNIPLVLGERDVLKVATTLPGVTTAGEGSAGFNVRGGKTDQNLILLDDAVMYNPSHFFGIFQALNPFAIRDVTIYKGSIPAEYGGRLSSVFDISTKDADNQDFKGEVSIGPVTANAVVEVPIIKGKGGLMVGGRGAYSDWILRSLDEENLKNSQASFYDFIAKYNHQINDNNEIRASGYYSRDDFSITSDSLFSYNNRLFSLKWNHRFNEKSSGSVLLVNSQYKFDIDFDGSVNENFLQRFQIEETELKIQLSHMFNESHKTNYGISGKLYSVLPGKIEPKGPDDLIQPISIPKEKALEAAIFVSDDFKVNEKLTFDLGFRYSFYAALGPSSQMVYQDALPKTTGTIIDTLSFDNNEVIETYGGPEVRISARYLLADDFSVKASFNNTYQFIHTLSNNTTVSPIDTWKLSDSHIKPQQANQFSLGLYKNIDVNKYELSLEGFYKKQQNTLDFKTGANLLLNKNIETEVLQGEGKAYGLEFLVRKNNGKLNGWMGYTYSRSLFKLDSEFDQERVNDGKYFSSNFDKPHDFSLVLNYKFTRRISLSGNFVYQTGRPVTFPIGNYIFNGAEYVLYSDRNQFRIPDYYRLDVGFNLEGNHKKKKFAHSFWNFSVYNVLGRNNPYSVFFVNKNGEIKALQSSIFAVPVPSITYNIKF